MQRLTVMLPTPSGGTGGNARGHWVDSYRTRKRAKYDVAILVRDAMNNHGLYGDVYWSPVRITPTWIFTNARHRPDPDNVQSRLKPYIDALVAVGLIADDGPDHVTIAKVEYERGLAPAVRLVIECEVSDA